MSQSVHQSLRMVMQVKFGNVVEVDLMNMVKFEKRHAGRPVRFA